MPLLSVDVRNWFRHEVDTGWAWVVVAASFTIQFIVYGIIQSYGNLFVALLDEFKSGEYETVGRDLMANAIGNFYGIISIPITLGPPVTGQLIDAFGSYTAPFSAAASSMLLGCGMMYFVYRLKPELIKDLPLQTIPEDIYTCDLITRPSIHSHTVDALSGMFLTERFSSIGDVDRPSQLTINPLHNLTRTFSRSRAGSTSSGPTQRFPSFALDISSEGRSEIFLQRLRGNLEGSSMGSRVLNVSTSNALVDHESLSSKDISLDLSNANVVAASSPKISSTAISESSEDSKSVTREEIIIGHFSKDDPSETNLVSLPLLLLASGGDDTNPTETSQEITDKQEVEDSTKQDNLEITCTTQPYILIDTSQENDQVLVSMATTNELKSNCVSSILDMNKGGIADQESTSTLKSPPHIEDFSVDVTASGIRSSSPISLVPDTKTATLICIDSDHDLDESNEISTTLIPDDIETTTETIVLDDIETSLESSEVHDEEILIKLPPPPTWNRELPLVDLAESETERAHDGHRLGVEDKNDRDEEQENVAQSPENENRMLVDNLIDSQTQQIPESILLEKQVNPEEIASAASILLESSTDLISLSERLQIVAEQQIQEGELTLRYPTDEMTLFATYRSNIATPSEQQGTPASQSIPRTPAPSTNQSPPRTPRQMNFIYGNDFGGNSTGERQRLEPCSEQWTTVSTAVQNIK
ncbi:hypothetical protein QZH41_020751, partial [Actinostola sp. cb2023]